MSHFRAPAVCATVGEKGAASLMIIFIKNHLGGSIIELLVGSIFIQIILKAMLLKFSEASTCGEKP